ncbi:endonuclease/exonuclease/phosphatase family protein [Kitasatospora sp. KL5]|uniref:endonuclease/exonuclease/phosphatase family protein n=1 Tax=Kitasatospora sp. KL5 TaxID=3425125 RepID=UPI003D6EBE43
MITVATWNVLHRVHAENWGGDIPELWPDEAERIAAVTARVAGTAGRIIALQEVSGDQLADLRRALPDRSIHAMKYPRIPSPRRVASRLGDRSEHLVLILDAPGEEVAAEAYGDDPGKGLLAVRTAGLLVAATHVSTGARRPGQLARLAEVVTGAPDRTVVLLGDFNADRGTVVAELGPGFAAAALPAGGPPTRPRTTGEKSQWIDHVIVRGATADGAVVEDAAGLSDHNPVRARVTPAP